MGDRAGAIGDRKDRGMGDRKGRGMGDRKDRGMGDRKGRPYQKRIVTEMVGTARLAFNRLGSACLWASS